MMSLTLSSLKFLPVIFLVLLLHVESSTHANAQCIQKERQALLEFKNGLIDDYGRLSSWGNQDCCRWNGVRCSNRTGHAEMLDLHGDDMPVYHPLRGKISTALMNLQHLKYLNLSSNDFNGSQIPEFIGSLSRLKYLDLSTASLSGKIPYQLGKLSSLQVLDLSFNHLFGVIPYQLGNLSNLQFLRLGLNDNLRIDESFAYDPWISNLSSLTELSLRGVNLHNSNKWLQMIGKLPHISKLWLSNCSLSDADFRWLFSSQHNSSASLSVLDLSINNITSSVFPRLFNLSSNLSVLYLGSNLLEGPIPNDIGTKMPHLELLDISGGQLCGTIPKSIGLLSKLQYLDLGANFLEGVITFDIQFANLTKLKGLSLYDNSLTLKFNHNWVPPFQLEHLDLDSCKVGPAFPKWLLTQNNLSFLDISDAAISDTIPKSLLCGDGSAGDRLKSLELLDLSNNQFSGQIPDCWGHLKSLVSLDLSNNQFVGSIPVSMGYLVEIRSLNFRNNNLTEGLPSLKNCTKLVLLDAGENELTGQIPSWVGDSMKSLEMLTLRKNHLNGSLPLQICHLMRIQILDISLNNLSGQIPRCLKNLSAMAKKLEFNETMTLWYTQNSNNDWIQNFVSYDLYPFVMWKGKELQFKNNRRLLKTIDLSNNHLTGEIPVEIGDLVELVSLNLSKNNLGGEIPLEIGNLYSLDFLDLSRNYFSGKIPVSLAQIDRLGVLDLSNNNLSGKIPTGTQLQSFNASVYGGNPYLCGSPLSKPCSDGTSENQSICNRNEGEEEEYSLLNEGFYMSLGLGFFTGFWGIFSSLLLIRSWRHAYFNFLNNLEERIYVMVVLNGMRIRRWFNN